MVEQLVLVGLCAFVGITAFYEYGRSLQNELHDEARLIEGQDLPDLDVVDWLLGELQTGNLDALDGVLSDLGQGSDGNLGELDTVMDDYGDGTTPISLDSIDGSMSDSSTSGSSTSGSSTSGSSTSGSSTSGPGSGGGLTPPPGPLPLPPLLGDEDDSGDDDAEDPSGPYDDK